MDYIGKMRPGQPLSIPSGNAVGTTWSERPGRDPREERFDPAAKVARNPSVAQKTSRRLLSRMLSVEEGMRRKLHVSRVQVPASPSWGRSSVGRAMAFLQPLSLRGRIDFFGKPANAGGTTLNPKTRVKSPAVRQWTVAQEPEHRNMFLHRIRKNGFICRLSSPLNRIRKVRKRLRIV
jgi:hypothetical protein